MMGLWLFAFFGFVLGILHTNGYLTLEAWQAFRRYVRAAGSPLLKRGWQSKVKANDFKLPELSMDFTYTTDAARLARYNVLCQIPVIDKLGTVPILFPEAMSLATDALDLMLSSNYPFPVMGSVHTRNWSRQNRAIASDEKLQMSVKILPEVVAVKRGTEVTAELTLTDAGAKEVWKTRCTYLVMHKQTKAVADKAEAAADVSALAVVATEQWKLPENLGRAYAGVSLDVNPIHLYGLFGKLFGFPRAIIHGMYTAARAFGATMNAAQADLRYPIEAEVAFKRPVLLPSAPTFTVRKAGPSAFSFTIEDKGKVQVEGSVKNV